MSLTQQKITALGLFLLYVVPRFLFSQWWMELPLSLNYGMEILYVLLVFFLFKTDFKFETKRPKNFIIYQGAYTFLLAIPLGYYRSKNYLLSCVALHFSFNLGFGLCLYFQASSF